MNYLIECERCGKSFKKTWLPKMKVIRFTRREMSTLTEEATLCHSCEEDLIEFMRKGVVDGTEN